MKISKIEHYIPSNYFSHLDNFQIIKQKLEWKLDLMKSPIKKIIWLYNSLKTIKQQKRLSGKSLYKETEEQIVYQIEYIFNEVTLKQSAAISLSEKIVLYSLFSKESEFKSEYYKTLLEGYNEHGLVGDIIILNDMRSIILPIFEFPIFEIDWGTDKYKIVGEISDGEVRMKFYDGWQKMLKSINNKEILEKPEINLKSKLDKDKIKKERRYNEQRDKVVTALHEFVSLPFILERLEFLESDRISRDDLKILFKENIDVDSQRIHEINFTIQKLDNFFQNTSNLLFFRVFLFDLHKGAEDVISTKFPEKLSKTFPSLETKKSTLKDCFYKDSVNLKLLEQNDVAISSIKKHKEFIKNTKTDHNQSTLIKNYLKRLNDNLIY